ncbi:abhydrolase domain-containing protein 8 [Fistulifera solaris]|jgi:pimeloyl-ACP methyl ester carboxylesterase|uniref:Abhydrolase domain-containing protein 8 n=1 Tax=Fistulifera solaris TaxID=1519565 RepID=A0A1Z5JS64_FISSO|nr:abhydrolase domain-containing protein 8 [Fistulifera solaris]|eukprot:GAX16864.1 abhydrolase domain-containing protein 8 [Fistulifera solaris]
MHHVPDACIQEIRPGRSVFVRQEYQENAEDNVELQLVFQHGTMATEQQYGLVLNTLKQRCGEYLSLKGVKFILYDCVGCGQSPSPADTRPSAFHNEELAKDFAAILDKFTDSTVPIIVIGHSYGPTIVLNTLRTNPLPNLRGLVLIGTSIRNPHLPHSDGGHPIMKLPLFMLRFLQRTMTDEFVKMSVHPDHTELREEVRKGSNRNDMALAKNYHRNMQWATVDDIQSIRNVPALIIHGKDDGVLPLECGQHLADQLPMATFVVVDSASHLVMLEQPEQVGEEILKFVKRCFQE